MELLRKLIDRGEGPSHVNTTEDLERLIGRARDERQALQALVTSAHTHAAQFPQVNGKRPADPRPHARRRAEDGLMQ